MAFPYNLSAHENSFMISATKSSAKNGAKLKHTELLNRVASLGKMNSILQYAILRTKYAVLVHLDVHSIPNNTETRVSKLKWMNEQCKKAGLTFLNHDNTYAVLSDAPLSYRAKPSYTPTDAKSVVICAPRSIRFRDINKATSLFGTFTSIQPLESNPSAKSHQYFEALFQNLGSSILAHQEKVQGITFTSGSPNLLKKQNIIDSIVKDHATSKWEATLLAAKEIGSEEQLRSINERLIVAKPQLPPTHPHSFSHPVLNVFTMSLLRDTDSLRPQSSQYQQYDLFIRLLVVEAISFNHSRSIVYQDIVPRIEKNGNTLERTLSSQCFPHAVWISFTHLLCVKILIHPSHERVLNCTPSVTLPSKSQPHGLSDLCHDCMKGLTFWNWFLLDPFSGRFYSGHDRQYGFTLDSRTRQDQW